MGGISVVIERRDWHIIMLNALFSSHFHHIAIQMESPCRVDFITWDRQNCTYLLPTIVCIVCVFTTHLIKEYLFGFRKPLEKCKQLEHIR